MNATIQRLDHLNVNAVTACAQSPPCDSYTSFNHVILGCHVGSPFVQSSSDQVAYVNNFQPKLNYDSYSHAFIRT